ncbi:CapA family protein [Brevibacillus fulvus]|uniref:Poly-gamma-glutamate synthesis protein (Capsule biosynthesis protein) n=1 Tax=Brevibacillus fulvus TaxID=1125967 RepID=A0A938XY11_9BACL|nr:CapA family protein [Brevibacillus fulvus]MBM7589946.1 poly-gamma-glutamate synthesis protein (capsule biosynthesis protein) [Brevibacillus fulvus]
MTTKIKIVAVGDILMWGKQIAAAKKNGGYSFRSMFQEVRPYLRGADLTIGNLETTFSGREKQYQQKNPKTGYPMFNCPDELAKTLKATGFDVLTTANNHCMDRGVRGLKRTLQVLDRHGFAHTGTYRKKEDSRKFLIKNVKGIRVGILAYTYGTNYISVPKSKPWLVNRIKLEKIRSDLRRLRKKADVTIVALHFGQEFRRYPTDKQKRLVKAVLKAGADVILGCHPHVLQPIVWKNRQFAIYSLGNFISARMRDNLQTESGVILNLTIKKEDNGETYVSGFDYIPTWTQKWSKNGKASYRVLPVKKFLRHPDSHISAKDRDTLKQVWNNTTAHLKGHAR